MEDFFQHQKAQWLDKADNAHCELLHSSETGEVAILHLRGRLSTLTDLTVSSPQERILFCLNEEGNGSIKVRSEKSFRTFNLIYLYLPAGSTIPFQRFAGTHRFTILAFSTIYLRGLLESNTETLASPIAKSLAGSAPLLFTEPMSIATKAFSQTLTSPPIVAAASQLWFQSKAVEFIATHCYELPDTEKQTFFCSQQKRLTSERINKAKNYLRAHLDQPLQLEAVATAAGTSPHYLSRTFSAETGLTLSRYLRRLRIEQATKLLAAGRLNISETSIEVGYRSQSHFARAFEIEKNCTPSQFITTLNSSRR